MQIVYDHQVFAFQRFGGISRYFVELAANLIARGRDDVRIVAPCYQNEYLADPRLAGRVIGQKVSRTFLMSQRRAIRWGNALQLRSAWRDLAPDIIHETYFSQLERGHGRMRVLTVYDMIHELFPADLAQTAAQSAAKRAAVARADHVICISASTQSDLQRLFAVPAEKTSVVHLGHALTAATGARAIACAATPFILYVGDRAAYKNFTGLMHAYAASTRLRGDYRLIAFGGRGFTDGELQLQRTLGIADRVSHTTGDDQLLSSHYQGARLFVCPSRYEGFGLPPLEAMAQGCPVACSNGGSIPEVVGGAGEYFDPLDVATMGAAIERVAYDELRRSQLVEAGLKRANLFTWQQCAERTRAVYEKLL
jgi:glycosyltransferase involved in cell wall biosynthesis